MIKALSVAVALLAVSPTAIQAGPANPDPKAAQAGQYAVEPLHTRVMFSVSHMGFTDWYGDFNGVSGTLAFDPARPDASRLDISIPVATVSTTNSKLDGELKSPTWLDATAYPTIRFVSSKVTLTGDRSASIEGNLTLHGVTRPVTLDASFNGAGTNPIDKSYILGFNGRTVIKRSDFGVTTHIPLIGDDTEIRVSIAFVKKPA